MEASIYERLMPIVRRSRLIRAADEAAISATVLAADGSTRRFVRLSLRGRPLCLAVSPASSDERQMAEAAAAWNIGRHLSRHGIPVPTLHYWDQDSGTILFEDLGDVRLHDLVRETDFANQQARASLLEVYRQAVDVLIAMQIEGAAGFDEQWCWDTARYDRQVMLEREAGYFLQSFWRDMLDLDPPSAINEVFATLADLASQAPVDFFLHRDFQSRNIMLKDGQVRIIDYQGGRLGPLGYDLASLLIDPYAALPLDFSEQLLGYYLERLHGRLGNDVSTFLRHYRLLALQRNLQIIGAFAFLSRNRGKVFFAEFIRPAVHQLRVRLQEPIFDGQAVLRDMIDVAIEKIDR